MMNIDHKLYHEARYDFYTNIGQVDLKLVVCRSVLSVLVVRRSVLSVVVFLPQNTAPALFCTCIRIRVHFGLKIVQF